MTDKPVTLVTGASRGIGHAAAVALAAAGHHVVATARTQGALEALDDTITAAGGSCTLVPLDLKDREATHQLGYVLMERYGRLDGLFANAGVLGEITPANHVVPKTWDEVMAVNLSANVNLVRALDPVMRAASAARMVFTTSSVARRPRAYWSAYAASKAALEVFVQCYSEEIAVTDMRANLLDPGGTATAMRAKAMPGEDPATLPQPQDLAPLVVRMLSPEWSGNGEVVRYREWAANA